MSQTDMGPGLAQVMRMVTVSVDRGETVTVTARAGATLNYYSNTCSPPAGTIVPPGSQAFTAPVWIQSQGPRTTVQITGGKYGAV